LLALNRLGHRSDPHLRRELAIEVTGLVIGHARDAADALEDVQVEQGRGFRQIRGDSANQRSAFVSAACRGSVGGVDRARLAGDG